jgi:hypothetical protein
MTDNSNNSNNFDSLQERNEQVLNDISQLQTQEKELYASLDDVNLSSEEKEQIINKINEISQTRINLYTGLKNTYDFYKKNVSAANTTLGQQITAIDILENELNQDKIKMNLIQEQKNNKLRLVEINTYYGKRYNAHTMLMKTIVVICLPMIVLEILANRGILPPKLYAFLSGIVLIIGCVLIGLQLIDMSNRDNMNWDEYNWYFNKSSAPSQSDITITGGSSTSNPWTTPSVTCIGSACCYDGSIYDDQKNMCVPNNVYQQEHSPSTDTDTKETFEVLGRYAKSQIKLFSLQNNVVPLYSSLSKTKY